MKILSFLLFLTITVHGQAKLSVNPGIKLGIAFGEETQFNFGYEISFVLYNLDADEYSRVGIVLNYDKIDDIKRLHAGLEYLYRALGIDFGPTFGWKNSEMHYGFSIIPFGGFAILPYLNYTNFKGLNDQFDFGTYIKIPIPLSKERFGIGG